MKMKMNPKCLKALTAFLVILTVVLAVAVCRIAASKVHILKDYPEMGAYHLCESADRFAGLKCTRIDAYRDNAPDAVCYVFEAKDDSTLSEHFAAIEAELQARYGEAEPKSLAGAAERFGGMFEIPENESAASYTADGCTAYLFKGEHSRDPGNLFDSDDKYRTVFAVAYIVNTAG